MSGSGAHKKPRYIVSVCVNTNARVRSLLEEVEEEEEEARAPISTACRSMQSDLADEHEHVERAGLGQVDRDGAVRDRQAPAPASNAACAEQHLVAQ